MCIFELFTNNFHTNVLVSFQIPANDKNHTSPPSSGLSDIGRERVKTFTYDYSYWSVNPTDRNFASQEKVRIINFIKNGHDIVMRVYVHASFVILGFESNMNVSTVL